MITCSRYKLLLTMKDADVRFFQLNSRPGGTLPATMDVYLISNWPIFRGKEWAALVNFSTVRPAMAFGSTSSSILPFSKPM